MDMWYSMRSVAADIPCHAQQYPCFTRHRCIEKALGSLKLEARSQFDACVVVQGWHMPMLWERMSASPNDSSHIEQATFSTTTPMHNTPQTQSRTS